MPDSTQDVDRYQEEISETVDDGGGCAEAWAALTQRREEMDVSRRSLLRKAGGTTAGVALASALGSALSSTAAASEDRSKEVLRLVEASEAFQAVEERVRAVVKSNDAVTHDHEERLFTSREVQELEVEETLYQISTHAGTVRSHAEDVDISVEISARVQQDTLEQVRALVKQRGAGETEYVSITHDTSEMQRTEALLEDEDLRANASAVAAQMICIPCDSPYCYSTCVAVWGTICYNDIGDLLCSSAYTTTAACLIIAALEGGVGGAICAIFLAAICEGDIGCVDTPENMCAESSSACDNPWLL